MSRISCSTRTQRWPWAIADPRAVHPLIQGMFMKGYGTDIFAECRLALVQIGAPAVPALVSLLDTASADSVVMAKQLGMEGSDVTKLPERAAIEVPEMGQDITAKKISVRFLKSTPSARGLWTRAIAKAVHDALDSGKIKRLSAGKMGTGTREVGDLIAKLVN